MAQKIQLDSFRPFELEGTVDELIDWLNNVKTQNPGYDEYRIESTEYADVSIVGIKGSS